MSERFVGKDNCSNLCSREKKKSGFNEYAGIVSAGSLCTDDNGSPVFIPPQADL